MEKKAKIIATLGPAIYNEKKLKKIINLGVDAFRINFSHDTKKIVKIVNIIRNLEKKSNKKLALIGDLQGIKFRIGKFKSNSIKINFKEKIIFENKKIISHNKRIPLLHSEIYKNIKKGNLILIDDGKYLFRVIKKNNKSIITRCESKNCILYSNKSVHVPGIKVSLNTLTKKDKKDIQFAKKIGCNWIALSYLQNSKIIKSTRKIINTDMGIIAKIENSMAVKNIDDIIDKSDALMIARGDLAMDVGHSDVPNVQLDIIKKCAKAFKPVIVATQMLETMIENLSPTRAEINDIATAIFQGADAVMLSAESAIGKNPIQSVKTMSNTILSTEKYKRKHIEDFKSKINLQKDAMKSMVLSIKDLAYNPQVKCIIAFSNSGKTAKIVSSMRPAVRIITISPKINISRSISLFWGVKSINSKDAKNWKEMMKISKEIIKKEKFINRGDLVIITAGLPFGKAKMTNMIRLYKVN